MSYRGSQESAINHPCLRLLDGQYCYVLNILVVYQAVVYYTLLSYIKLDQAERSTYGGMGRAAGRSC